MNKIIYLFISAFLALSPLVGNAAEVTAKVVTDSVTKVVATFVSNDTLETIKAFDDTVMMRVITDGVPIDDDEQPSVPSVMAIGGHWKIAYDGNVYNISDLVDAAEAMADDNRTSDEVFFENNASEIIWVFVLVFGLPCLTIIVVVAVVLIYQLSRSRQRKAVLDRAIDNNYQLPPNFFGNPKGDEHSQVRDSRKFYSAVSLISVGIGLIIFAVAEHHAPFFYLAGAIPLLMGVGRMIGYFYVFPTHVKNQQPPYGPQQPFYGPQPPYDPQPPFGPQPPYGPQDPDFGPQQAPFCPQEPQYGPRQAPPCPQEPQNGVDQPSCDPVDESTPTPPPYRHN